jgi:hypothetical protein
MAGNKPTYAFEYVQYATDADVPKEFQYRKPINAIGNSGSLPDLWLSSTTPLRETMEKKVCFT